jgi:hypothetical protein
MKPVFLWRAHAPSWPIPRLPKLVGVELLPYFDHWRAKLNRFGLTIALPDTVKPPSRETMKSWSDYLRERGVNIRICI